MSPVYVLSHSASALLNLQHGWWLVFIASVHMTPALHGVSCLLFKQGIAKGLGCGPGHRVMGSRAVNTNFPHDRSQNTSLGIRSFNGITWMVTAHRRNFHEWSLGRASYLENRNGGQADSIDIFPQGWLSVRCLRTHASFLIVWELLRERQHSYLNYNCLIIIIIWI